MISATTPALASRLPIMKMNIAYDSKNTEGAYVPEFSGSTLRGSFGHAFRNVVCSDKGRSCAACPARQECAYFDIFESQELAPEALARGFHYRPHPFVLSEIGRKGGNRPQRFSFSFLLMGDYQQHSVSLIQAFDRMAQVGLGAQRSPFSLAGVTDALTKKAVWHSGQLVNPPQKSSIQEVVADPRQKNGEGNGDDQRDLRLRFVTPLRLVRKQKPLQSFDADFFWRMLVQRYEWLHRFYGEMDERDLDLKPPAIVPINMRYEMWQRYSNRQKRHHKHSGLVGDITLHGLGPKERQFVRVMQMVHMGKNTAFGLGKAVASAGSHVNMNDIQKPV